MKYTAILHKSEYGFDIHIPALPGCVSQGDTESEALENIQDAIKLYLEMEKSDLPEAYVKEVEVALS